ncbi:SIR2 family NAD-dependent protein deacylase [Fibrella aquatica]|uniref:SIR2 family NAD-dependent protein deacylase n=1 Tax=Fibrella aquatica TaxID=3242487 RepID=UPI00352209F1
MEWIDDDNIRIGEVDMNALGILQRDEKAYEAEYQRWFNEWLNLRMKRLDNVMGLVPDNRARFTDLGNALERGVVLPFVGAGMSIASGMKSWKTFLYELRTAGTCTEAELDAFLDANPPDYEAAADLVYNSMTRQLFLNRMNTRFKLMSSDICGPVCLLPKLFNERVFTTNFDHILEEVYALEGLSFDFVLRGNEQLDRARQAYNHKSPSLLKLHGDELASRDRVFTREEYDRAYSPSSILRRELGHAVDGTNSLLFLGCSLDADRTMHVLHEVAQRDDGTPEHYAFLPYDANKHRERENFLAERGIYPIWYNAPDPTDHDESIEALLVGLLRKMNKLDAL